MPAITVKPWAKTIREMAKLVREVNEHNGWFDSTRTIGEGAALLHSEVSEAFDAWRKHGFADVGKTTHAGSCAMVINTSAYGADYVCDCNCGAAYKPEGYGSELADVLIRLLDQADRDGVDLVAEFVRKMEYNATRGYHHGGRAV